MIRTVSLLPLAAGVLSIALALFTLAASSRRSATVRYFLGLNAGTALWSLAYFVVLNLDAGEPLLAPFGSPLYFLGLAITFGVAAAPTYWFLFAASYTPDDPWTRAPRVYLAHVPLVYTALVAGTNPLHHLFFSGVTADGSVAYGPLAPPHQIATFALLVAGICFLVGRSWRRGTSASRRQAVVLGAASSLTLVGGLVWSLRHLLGLSLAVNPTPVLFPVVNLALGLELLRTGLADIVPYATQQAFNAVSDAAVALNSDGVIVAMNASAEALLPGSAPGTSLGGTNAELASAAQSCLAAADYAGFDVWLDGHLYWGRARPTRDRHGMRTGCVLLLTDVTEVRTAQACRPEPEADAG